MAGGLEFCPLLGATTQCIQGDCEWWAGSECGINVLRTEMVKYASHIHDSHLHQAGHSSATIPADAGGPQQVVTLPLASLLAQEYMSNEDKTGNGEVYGYDYQIDLTDQEAPPILVSLADSNTWPNPTEKKTWEEVKTHNGY